MLNSETTAGNKQDKNPYLQGAYYLVRFGLKNSTSPHFSQLPPSSLLIKSSLGETNL